MKKMNRYYLCLVLLCSFRIATAQDLPEYGSVSRAEKDMTVCEFDKDANSVILADEAYSDHDDEGQLITVYRRRIKILKEKGIEDANIAIAYYTRDGFEFINGIEGYIIYKDNGVEKSVALDKKSIYDKKVNDYYSEKRFTYPNVKPGCIIEYKYRSIMKSYGGLRDWHFQSTLPVAFSKYTLVILPRLEFAYSVQKNTDMNVEINKEPKSGMISFIMKNIPSLSNEPYMDARKDYLQMVSFQLSGFNTGTGRQRYMNSWEEVGRELHTHSSFGNVLGKNIPGTDEFIKIVKLIPSHQLRMNKVFDYVRSNMEWNGMNSIYASDGVKTPWTRKSGTNGEINLILINLLKEAELDVYPMLVSERYHGKVETSYPFIEQFNTVFAAVYIDGKPFYLDATDKFTPPHIIPYSILNTTAFIARRKKPELLKIEDKSFDYKDIINVTAAIATDGNLKGSVYMSSTDYARAQRLNQYNGSRDKYISKYIQHSSDKTKIDSFEIVNLNNDSMPLIQKFQFAISGGEGSEYVTIPLNLFTNFQNNPFTNTYRFSNVNFGYRQLISFNCYFDLPENYTASVVPKPIQMTNTERTIVFKRITNFDEKSGKLMSRISVELNKSLFDAGEYPDLREFYKKMFDLLNEPIVLKKKA